MSRTAQEIAELDEDDFERALTGDKEYLGDIGDRIAFAPYVDPLNAMRTFGYLADLQGSLKAKIALNKPRSSTDDWEVRTRKFLGLVESRLTYTQSCIRIHTREAVVSRTAAIQPWKIFAHRLCEALDSAPDQETQDLLDSIPSPFPDMSAGAWLMRRLEKNPARTGANVK